MDQVPETVDAPGWLCLGSPKQMYPIIWGVGFFRSWFLISAIFFVFFVYWSTMELVGLPWFHMISPVVCCFPPLFPTFFDSIYKPLDDHWPALLRLLGRCQSRQSHDADSNLSPQWDQDFFIALLIMLCYALLFNSMTWLHIPEYLDGFSNFSTNSPGFQMHPQLRNHLPVVEALADQEMHHLNDPQTSGWENGCRKPRHSWSNDVNFCMVESMEFDKRKDRRHESAPEYSSI